MANEEQRRAFESYMGGGAGEPAGSGQNQGQPVPQYPGAFANPANPFLLNVTISLPLRSRDYDVCELTSWQQFPGIGVPPAAPTPPPAAPSSDASFSQGGFPQAGFPVGFGQGGYGQTGLPQRPPPLGDSRASYGQQQAPQLGRRDYAHNTGHYYSNQVLPPIGFDAGWQHADPNVEQARRLSGAPQGAMADISRNGPPRVIVESGMRQTDDYYHYHQRGQYQEPEEAQMPDPHAEKARVPVMLCHTCSHCGQMRSSGFHRNNPVLPGKILVSSACRRCKKKIKSGDYDRSGFARIRSCTSDEPCDWHREPVHDEFERRGRRQNRAECHVSSYSPSCPRVLGRSSSQARLGLGVFQQQEYARRVRVSPLGPYRDSRQAGIWPPPDVVGTHAFRSDNVFPAPPEPLHSHTSRSNEVWPPPDIVRTHSIRTLERSPPGRQSTRIVELSPSPPPTRTRSSRTVFRSESLERRPRSCSQSPVRTRVRENFRSEEAEARLAAHPRAFRTVSPNRHTVHRASDETSSNTESMSRSQLESPNRSSLKPEGMERRPTDRRRRNMRESQQSMHVEVGGPRVHFRSERRDEERMNSGRRRHMPDRAKHDEDYEDFREYSRHRRTRGSSPAPPMEDFEKLHMRRSSPSPRNSVEEDIHVSRARRLSHSPPPPRRYKEVRVRYTSPMPRYERNSRNPPSPSPERPPYPEYRYVSRTRHISSSRSLTPPPSRHRMKAKVEMDDVTDSDSTGSEDVIEVRSWKGVDENGRPTRFVEEKRRTVGAREQGSGRGAQFRPMADRTAPGSWRYV